MLKHLPNLLSFYRLIVGFMFWGLNFLFPEKERILSLILIISAGVSDFLDGFLARKFRWKTLLGAYLDPLADKIFINFLFLWFYFKGMVSSVLICIVLLKDFSVVLGFFLLKGFTKKIALPKPSIFGKISTFFQMIYLALLCFHCYLLNLPGDILVFGEKIVMFFTLVALFGYSCVFLSIFIGQYHKKSQNLTQHKIFPNNFLKL